MRPLPPWALGLANAPMGFYYGFLSTAMPILLAAQGVSIARIALISTVAFSPSFWAWLLCPVLDVGLSKKAYAAIFYAIAAACLCASVLLLRDLGALTLVLTTGCAAAVIAGNAVGGSIPDLVGDRDYNLVGAWFNIANLGAAGLFGTIAVVLVRALALPVAAALLGLLLLAPTALLLYFPASTRPTRAAAEVFETFFRDLWRVTRRPASLYGLLIFLLPASSFALTNLFASVGTDFHTSERWVTAIGGLGVAVACSLGCLLGIPLCRRLSRRTVYLATGLCAAAVTTSMIYAPRTLATFAAGVLLYNLFQGVNYTSFSALIFEIVGPANPLAGTQLALLTASVNAPISYMTALDGLGAARHGIAGLLATDAVSSVTAGVPLLLFFWYRSHKSSLQTSTIRTSII